MKFRRALLLACGLALLIAMGAIAGLGDLGRKTDVMLAWWGVAYAAYAAATIAVLRSRSSGSLAIVIGFGLLARLLLLPTAPTLSEDVYRYLWDGRLVAHGVNPFPHAPSDPALAAYRNHLTAKLNHKDVPTIYPPAAQILFAAAASVSETPAAWKLLLLLLEALLALSLLRILRARGLPEERLLLYYWNPLVLVESFGSGHVDLAAAAFLVLVLALQGEGKRVRAGAAFALATLTKLVPAVMVPYWARRRAWVLLASAALASLLLVAPFLPAGSSLATGLEIYARHWEFNGAAYRLLRHVLSDDRTIRRVLAATLALATIAVAGRARSATAAALGSLVALLLLNPTLYPWYLVPVVALLPLHPDPGLILFSGAVALSYLPLPAYRATGVWTLPSWILVVEYGALLGAWTLSLAARLRVHQREHADVQEADQVEEEER